VKENGFGSMRQLDDKEGRKGGDVERLSGGREADGMRI
jgi:hypothetical protein